MSSFLRSSDVITISPLFVLTQKVIAAEHGVNFEGQYEGNSPKQLSRIEVFFDEAQRSRYVPRAVLVDLDDSSLDSISSGPNGAMFNPDNFIAGQVGTSDIGHGYMNRKQY